MLKSKPKIHNSKEKYGEVEVLKGQLARALADYDNLSRRIERERDDLAKIASIGLIIKLLPLYDDLENAQNHLKDPGLAISVGEFKKVLNEEGIIEIRPKVGDEFNENEMEAVDTVSGNQKGKVSELVLVGWKFDEGTVVRHAKVKVYN